jgi:hypothetical protein
VQEHNQTGTQDAIRNVARLAVWTFAWLATLALAKFGPSILWDSQPVASWIAIAANLVVGAGWIVAHARYLQRADELQRKIMLDAMAVALGVGLVGGFAYSAADNADLIAFDANIAFLSVLMGVVYMVTIAVENLRYR